MIYDRVVDALLDAREEDALELFRGLGDTERCLVTEAAARSGSVYAIMWARARGCDTTSVLH